MARIRTLKPEFWQDEKMALLPPLTRLVFLGLVSQADDAGRLVDNVKLLDGLLFPYTEDTCDFALQDLAALGRIIRYRSESGQPLIQIANWEKHQKVKNPSQYNLPAPSPERMQQAGGEPGENRGRTGGESNAPTVYPRSPIPDPRSYPPGGRAEARDAIAPEEDLPEVPNDTGQRQVIPLPQGRVAPFATQDWDGRVSGAVVLQEWMKLQPTRPSSDDRNRFGRACKRIADQHTTGEVALAFIGMRYLWPWAEPPTGKGQPWTPEDLLRDFAKAVPAAQKHPQFKAAQTEREFNEALSGGGW